MLDLLEYHHLPSIILNSKKSGSMFLRSKLYLGEISHHGKAHNICYQKFLPFEIHQIPIFLLKIAIVLELGQSGEAIWLNHPTKIDIFFTSSYTHQPVLEDFQLTWSSPLTTLPIPHPSRSPSKTYHSVNFHLLVLVLF